MKTGADLVSSKDDARSVSIEKKNGDLGVCLLEEPLKRMSGGE